MTFLVEMVHIFLQKENESRRRNGKAISFALEKFLCQPQSVTSEPVSKMAKINSFMA